MQLLMTFKIPTSMSGTQMNLSQTSSTSLLSQSSEEIRRGKSVVSQGRTKIIFDNAVSHSQ